MDQLATKKGSDRITSQTPQSMDQPTAIIPALALEYKNSNISVIPVRLDGSKAPAIPSWSDYQQRLPDDEELTTWFSRPCGIGIVCGIVSGGLEVIDFDDGSLFYPWFDAISSIASKLIVVETPSDGYHVIYRCCEIGGNRKIAVDPSKEKQTLIESRGQGGYIVGVGSPLGVHARKNRTYIQIMGPVFPDIPMITPSERVELWRAGRAFTKVEFRLPAPKAKPIIRLGPMTTAERIIAAFNRAADWSRLLPGWTSRDGIHWTRPGKTFGTSAKVCFGEDGTPLLSVFSSNAGPLTPDSTRSTSARRDIQSYSAFEVLVRLQFNGDRKAAFKAVREGKVV